MNTPLKSASLTSALTVCGVLVAAAFVSRSTTAYAASSSASPPQVTISVKQQQGEFVQKAAGGQGGQAAGGGKGGAGGGGKGGSSVGATNKAWLVITIGNDSTSEATGLTVNYHVYVKTTTMSGSSANVTWQDNQGSKAIDSIAKNSKTDIETDHIQIQESSSVSSSSSKGVSKSSVSSNVTSLAGWYVEVQYNGKVINKKESESGIKANYDKKYGN